QGGEKANGYKDMRDEGIVDCQRQKQKRSQQNTEGDLPFAQSGLIHAGAVYGVTDAHEYS
ncbi:hypothetical protein, partial [Brucella abortus]|uniref:hypothetical protein n=1 Tax=Brucella abortus TaxID=235 RepID=UPI003080E0D3